MACNVGEIPLVFDNSLTYYEQIAAFSAKLNDVISTVNVQSLTLCEFMQQLTEAFKELSDDFAEQWADIQAAFVQLRGRVNTLDERVTALENLPLGVGLQIPEGTQYEYEGETYTAGTNCEIFGCYETQDSNTKNEAAGNYSHAEGVGTKAYFSESHAEGKETVTLARASHAEGIGSQTHAQASHAEGSYTTTSEFAAHAEGESSTASGRASHAEGYTTAASGNYSHAEGSQTIAGGTSSHAEGAGCTASADYSHAGGVGCTASGSCSFVHGMASNASGNNSGAIGAGLIASGNEQFVCGHANEEKNSDYLFIVGNGVTGSTRSNALEIDKYGNIYSNGSAKPLNVLTDENRAELIELVNVPGKNKLSFSEIGTNNSHGVTFSSNGVDWTLNADGTITATRTSSSTTDSSCNLRIDTGSLYIDDFCNGSFVLSGCPEGGGENTFSLRALRDEDYRETDTGSGVILPDRGAFSNIYINMLYSKDYTGEITFRPMICSKTAFIISPAWIGPETPEASGGVTVYTNSDYTITPYSATDPHADYLNASATGYQIGDLQTVHIAGSYTVYYSVSSDTGYKICEIDVPGTIADDEKEIAAVTDYMQYLTSGSVHCLFIAKIETVSSTKKLCIYYKSAGESHGSSGINKSFDITATFRVSQ